MTITYEPLVIAKTMRVPSSVAGSPWVLESVKANINDMMKRDGFTNLNADNAHIEQMPDLFSNMIVFSFKWTLLGDE